MDTTVARSVVITPRGDSNGNPTTATTTTTANIITQTSPTTSPTNSSTNHPKPTSSNGKSSGGVSSGAAAGIGFGCAIAGLLLGILIFSLLRRRPRRSTTDETAQSRTELPPYSNEKGVAVSTIPLSVNSAAGTVENNLPNVAADSEIKNEYSIIDDRINNHVRSFFNADAGANYNEATGVISQTLGSTHHLSNSQIASMLTTPHSRQTLIRAAIARVLTSRMGLDAPVSTSLLAGGIPSILGSVSGFLSNDNVKMAFLSKWRTMTAYLMNGKTNTMGVSGSEENIRKAVNDVDSIVGPLAASNADPTQRLNHLEEVVRRASRVANLLFAQPSFWNFDWQHNDNGIVVFPALLKLTDEHGKLLPQPIVFEDRKVV